MSNAKNPGGHVATLAPFDTSDTRRLLEILYTTSFRYCEDPQFRLSSGILSPYYIDCKMAFSNPEARRLIGELVFEKIYDLAAEGIGGLAIGAYPVAIAASDVAYAKKGQILRAFVVRKEPKPHGLKKFIEGDVKSGNRVIIVDDVITSGKSTIEAIEKCQDAGLKILKAIALIDRQEEGGKENIEQHEVTLETLFTLQDFKDRPNER